MTAPDARTSTTGSWRLQPYTLVAQRKVARAGQGLERCLGAEEGGLGVCTSTSVASCVSTGRSLTLSSPGTDWRPCKGQVSNSGDRVQEVAQISRAYILTLAADSSPTATPVPVKITATPECLACAPQRPNWHLWGPCPLATHTCLVLTGEKAGMCLLTLGCSRIGFPPAWCQGGTT